MTERTEQRASSVMQGPPSPEVTKKSGSLPARKIGLVTVLSPNGHTVIFRASFTGLIVLCLSSFAMEKKKKPVRRNILGAVRNH